MRGEDGGAGSSGASGPAPLAGLLSGGVVGCGGGGGGGPSDAKSVELRGVRSPSCGPSYGAASPYVKFQPMSGRGSGRRAVVPVCAPLGLGATMIAGASVSARASSIAESTERSLDASAAFRCAPGTECLRGVVLPFGGDTLPAAGGDVERGGEESGEVAPAHAVVSAVNGTPVVAGSQDEIFVLAEEGSERAPSASGVPAMGLDAVVDMPVMMESGARMLKIWSSACGGPYESKGSGTDCSIGSMTGSDLCARVSEQAYTVPAGMTSWAHSRLRSNAIENVHLGAHQHAHLRE